MHPFGVPLWAGPVKSARVKSANGRRAPGLVNLFTLAHQLHNIQGPVRRVNKTSRLCSATACTTEKRLSSFQPLVMICESCCSSGRVRRFGGISIIGRANVCPQSRTRQGETLPQHSESLCTATLTQNFHFAFHFTARATAVARVEMEAIGRGLHECVLPHHTGTGSVNTAGLEPQLHSANKISPRLVAVSRHIWLEVACGCAPNTCREGLRVSKLSFFAFRCGHFSRVKPNRQIKPKIFDL